jgi:hypothetical protein
MPPFRIAVITTCFRPRAHADVIVSRWHVRRPADAAWGWSGPKSRVTGLYAHQCPDNDMSRSFCAEHGIALHHTVAGALCAGGSTLAVDGVMLIGEHGEYPHSSLGAHMYPRKEFFDEIVRVFRDSGRSVPVFCDKHFSWNWEWAQEMFRTSEQIGFLLFGGSSIPLCPRGPALDLTSDDRVKKAVAIFFEGREAYGYHSVEYAQSILECRRGGESGVESITAFPRDRFSDCLALDADFKTLLDQAIATAPTARSGGYLDHCDAAKGFPESFLVQHRDGLSVLHVNLTGHIENWAIALSCDTRPRLAAAAALHGGPDEHFPHFAALSRVIEDGLMTGKPAHDPKRNLLTTGITALMMQAFAQPGIPLKTPGLNIAYSRNTG